METRTDEGLGQVRLLRDRSDVVEERLRWARFREAETPEAFFRSWLALQCDAIEAVEAGLLLAAGSQSGSLEPVATWPAEGRPGRHLFQAAERVLHERRPLALQLDPRGGEAESGTSKTLLIQPVEAGGELVGAVVLQVEPRSEEQMERALRRLTWGSAWLALHMLERSGGAGNVERLESLLKLVAAPLAHERFRAAAAACVNELAARFGSERASLGFVHAGGVRLEAVSHSSGFGKHASLIRAIEAAMDEALDQAATVIWPGAPEGRPQVTRNHAELARESDAGSICSVPVAYGPRFCAVFTLERGPGRPFAAAEIELIETAASLAAPTLDVQRRDDRWLAAKVLEAARDGLARLFGPRHVALKLCTASAVLLAAFLALAKGEFRVTADMVLEAQVLRAAVAPFDGYIAEAPLRAGDHVRAGDLLATLEDRELALERARWASQLGQLQKQHRLALTERDASQVAILDAQIDQARAQLGLVEDRLARTRLTAPFDGVVVTGDLSQELGAPVQRGEVLFEVAPLEAYRVALQVDERDVDEVATGQTGTLAFAAFPDEGFPFRVDKVTPVSTPGEGRNTFRVEASLAGTPARLRPGMEGVAKVEVGQRRLFWIWTHEAIDWLRLALWNWLP